MGKYGKTALTSTLIGIGISATLFCLSGLIFDQRFGGNFQMDNYLFTKMVIGTIVIGIGFGLPSFIYQNEQLSFAIQTLFHMGVGCIVLTITAYAVGWLPTSNGILPTILVIAIEIGIAFAIWFVMFLHQRGLAREMNKRISEMGK